MPAFTIIEESVGEPIAVVKARSLPKRGDTVWVRKFPYKVVGRDRDVLVVRSEYQFADNPTDPSAGRRRPRSVQQSGYRAPYKQDLPVAHPTRGPVIPSRRSDMPYVAPGATYEAPFPFYQPRVFIAYHQTIGIPLFQVESTYPPKIGERYALDDWMLKFEITGHGEGDFIYAKPTVPWVYVAVSIDKKTGNAIGWYPYGDPKDMGDAKAKVKEGMEYQLQIPRRDYRMTHKRIVSRAFRMYFKNPGRAPLLPLHE